MGGREQRGKRRRVLFILNEVEVATDKRVNGVVCRGHSGEEERIKGEITTLGVEINIENLKGLMRTRDGGVPTELNKATRNRRKGDISRNEVLENVGGVNDSSPPTIHTHIVPRDNAVGEGKGKPFVGS